MTRETQSLLGIIKCQAIGKKGERPFLTNLRTQETISYEQLARAAENLCGFLEEQNIKAGDRVVLVSSNHWAFYPLLAACTARKAVLVPTSPDLHPEELKQILEDASPALIIHDDPVKVALLPQQPKKFELSRIVSYLNETRHGQEAIATSQEASSSAALMIYTSGSTGRPKGVTLTEKNLLVTAIGVSSFYGMRESDRLLCFLPMYHTNAVIMTGLAPLMTGAHIFLSNPSNIMYAKFFWKNISEYKVTIISLVPSIMSALLQLNSEGTTEDISSLRFAFCGTAPLSPELWERFESTFTKPVYQGYGLTETTCWAACTPPRDPRKYDTVGIPVESEIIIDDAPETAFDNVLPEAEGYSVGQVLIRGPIVMAGYHGQSELTAQQFKGRYFKTGDLGYFDSEGYLHIVGRIKEIIIKNGVNILPQEIDRVLAQHPAIQEVKTVGVENELTGETIISVCVPKQPQTPPSSTEIKKFVRERVSAYKCPDRIIFMDSLPKTATGKVIIGKLRQRVVSSEQVRS